MLSVNDAYAADPIPRVDIDGKAEVQNDWAFAADTSNLRSNDLTLSIEPDITFHLAPGLTLVSELVLESLSEVVAGNDRNFGDLGLSVETLFLAYAGNGFGARGGKINPAFGRAWDLAPGLYGTDFAEDY